MGEVTTQNISNSPTTICKKSKKNIMVQNPDKLLWDVIKFIEFLKNSLNS
ncbi:MAG: hypothetical protein LBT66_00525 [Methanobrevibacter sp.]|jgi:diphthamide synthase subunit DPH2|nr:hypothetical protein [Candidatus Methanovirga meridionalis]